MSVEVLIRHRSVTNAQGLKGNKVPSARETRAGSEGQNHFRIHTSPSAHMIAVCGFVVTVA